MQNDNTSDHGDGNNAGANNATDNHATGVKKAVALKYDGKNAPNVTASGHGELAEEIVRLALAHEVPLFENPELAGLLADLELGEEVPQALYHCIAHIIAFAYKIQGKVPEGWDETPSN